MPEPKEDELQSQKTGQVESQDSIKEEDQQTSVSDSQPETPQTESGVDDIPELPQDESQQTEVQPESTETIPDEQVVSEGLGTQKFPSLSGIGPQITADDDPVYSEEQISKLLERGQVSEEWAQQQRLVNMIQIKAERIAQREIRKTLSRYDENSVWQYTVGKFKEASDQNSPLFKLANDIYKTDPFLASDPKGQYYAVLEASNRLKDKDLNKARQLGRKDAIQNKRIISKAFIENATPPREVKKEIRLTPEEDAFRVRSGMSKEEWQFYKNTTSATDVLVKK